MKLKNKKNKTIKLRHKIALFLVYFVLLGTLTSLIDYYAYDLINPWIFIILSFFGALWATWVHSKSKEKTKADELAEDIEDLL